MPLNAIPTAESRPWQSQQVGTDGHGFPAACPEPAQLPALAARNAAHRHALVSFEPHM